MHGDKEDRISSLPDCLLVDIISRLPTTKHAIRTTSTLSKRWQHLWTLLPNLVFVLKEDFPIYQRFATDLTRYYSFIDKTLIKCHTTNLDLNMFKLDLYDRFWSTVGIRAKAISWIHNAISRNCKEVDLRLWGEGYKKFICDDELFFNNSYFTHVKVSLCVFSPPLDGVISWCKLKYLHIYFGILDEDMIGKILSRSPCLETLELNECKGYKRIDITSKSVKKLVFTEYSGPKHDCGDYPDSIEINAPYILSLTIQGMIGLREVPLLNVSSLVNAKLDFSGYDYQLHGCMCESVEEDLLRRLLQSLGHVNNITFGDYCSELLSYLESEDVTSSGSDSEDEGLHTSSGSDLVEGFKSFSLTDACS